VILTAEEKRQIERLATTMLLSPAGREWSRPFLTERGKGDEGSLAQVKKEMFEILSKRINELYGAPAPVQSR
jgi:hypothetical protein